MLTTGFAFKDNPNHLKIFILKLNKVGVCGLILKGNRFIKDIPLSVIETADAITFPILMLSGSITLGELSWYITGYLSDYKRNKLSHAINLQK